MKACPFCEAELRDSVIRCTRCGRSLRDASGTEPIGAPTPTGYVAAARHTPAPSPPSRAPGGWATPSTRTERAGATSIPGLVARRALPTDRKRSGRPDLALLLAAVVSAGAGVVAWRTIAHPWVTLVITDTSNRLDPVLVGELTLRAKASVIGTIGQGLGAALVGFGALWVFYGFDRGSTMPWFTNPSAAILVSVAGIGTTVVSAVVWFAWEEAAVGHSSALDMSQGELRALLNHQPPPLVEIQRLSGLMRFGGVMLLGALAASAAWWAYHKRA